MYGTDQYDDESECALWIGVDERRIPPSKMFHNGFLFNYGTQQNWVWMIFQRWS